MNIIPDKFFNQITNSIYKIDDISNVEVEARFGTFTNRFTSGVERHTFLRLKKKLLSELNTYTFIHSRDNIYDESDSNVRYTIIFDNNGLPIENFRTKKVKIDNIDIHDFFMRIGISKEYTDYESMPEKDPLLIREKKRWSFNLNTYRLDLTEVTTYRPESKNPTSGKTVYEIELEIEKPIIQNLDNFRSSLNELLKLILDTSIIYTQTEQTNLIYRINNYLGSNNYKNYPTNAINYLVLSQAVNLKVKHLSYGVLLPNTNSDTYYTVTIKADGFRKLLVIDNDGVYLVSPPNNINKIMKSEDVKKFLTKWIGTVIEGELIPKENILDPNLNVKYYYLMYDVLSASGDPKIRKSDLMSRLNIANGISTNFGKVIGLRFIVKEYYNFKTIQEYYNNVRIILDKNYNFKTDGLVFTPLNYPYVDKHQSYKIYKWKPLNMLTIDFEIRHVSTSDKNYVELLSGVKNKYSLLPDNSVFTGTDIYPFDSKTDMFELPEYYPNGTIVEFVYSNDVDEPEDTPKILLGLEKPKIIKGKLKVTRVRYDKTKPNSMDVAIDNWLDIHNGIDEDTIKGLKFNLMFRYHNREKMFLYNYTKGSKSLLDIGSGKGGDVSKWVKLGYTHIICVEPNDQNRNVLISRLQQTKLKYIVLPTTGEDTETISNTVKNFIPGGKVDVISYMLSLSFFFKDSKSYTSIIYLSSTLVKPDGYFIAFTIDGRSVKEYFNTVGNYSIMNKIKKANLNMIEFDSRPQGIELLTSVDTTQKSEKETIFINIPESIVQNQVEFILSVSSLIKHLQERGNYSCIYERKADQKTLMTEEEIIFSKLYTLLVLKRK